jgi:hypothetical protein
LVKGDFAQSDKKAAILTGWKTKQGNDLLPQVGERV